MSIFLASREFFRFFLMSGNMRTRRGRRHGNRHQLFVGIVFNFGFPIKSGLRSLSFNKFCCLWFYFICLIDIMANCGLGLQGSYRCVKSRSQFGFFSINQSYFLANSMIVNVRSNQKSVSISGEEGTTLCNIIANRHGKMGSKLRGDIIINGNK